MRGCVARLSSHQLLLQEITRLNSQIRKARLAAAIAKRDVRHPPACVFKSLLLWRLNLWVCVQRARQHELEKLLAQEVRLKAQANSLTMQLADVQEQLLQALREWQ